MLALRNEAKANLVLCNEACTKCVLRGLGGMPPQKLGARLSEIVPGAFSG